MLEVRPLASRVRKCAVSALRFARLRMRGPSSWHTRSSLPLRRPFAADHWESHPCGLGRDLPVGQTRGCCFGPLPAILLESKSCTHNAGNALESYPCKKIGGAPPLSQFSSGIKPNSRVVCTSEIIQLEPPLESTLAKKQGWGVPLPNGLLS